MDVFRNAYARTGAFVGTLALPGLSFATEPTSTLDVSGVESYISGDVTTGLATVGGVIIIAAVTAMGFKWIKGMIFS